MDILNNKEYLNWLSEIKSKIKSAQIKASLSVNKELLNLYWQIGKSISNKIEVSEWGNSVVDNLSKDLTKTFPSQKGFSRRNLFNMKKWYEFYSKSDDLELVQQLVAQLPWGHNIHIISKAVNVDEALFYAGKTVENNWSRSVLVHQVESGLYERQGNATTNFPQTLPEIQSELANETLKDPYKFDFLSLSEKVNEKGIKDELVRNIISFLLELGAGFSFVGKEYRVVVGDKEYYINLLFYHLKLRCYVVVEMKIDEFKPEYAGKLNFYLSAVNEKLKSDFDNPTIGLLLCKSKNKIEAEYSLRGMTQPMGVADYKLSKAIPDDIKSELPSIEKIESELSDITINDSDE